MTHDAPDPIQEIRRELGLDGRPPDPPPLTDADDPIRRISGLPSGPAAGKRTIDLTPASAIKIRPVHWLWEQRLPLGTLGLIAGREGLGKSTFAYGRAADITKGRLPGVYHGQPKGVIVAATEDSWEHTIVPRLMAADADLNLVYRVDVTTSEGVAGYLSLPNDIKELERQVAAVDAALILLDPLMSRLDSKLDAHKDPEVRLALEPLVAVADKTRAVIWGLIHVNKGTSSDPLTMIMGSRAFTAVARSVLMFARDPQDESDATVLVGQVKNNLGRLDLPTMCIRIVGAHVADTDEGPVYSSRAEWAGETDQTIKDALADATADPEVRTQVGECADWLSDYLTSVGGTERSKTCVAEAKKAGDYSWSTVKRARRQLRLDVTSEGFPRTTWWSLPGTQPTTDESSEGPI